MVLVAISAASVLLVNKARDDSGWVIHTVEVENQISTLLLEIRRAEAKVARPYRNAARLPIRELRISSAR